ncbi:MAG: fluoride efflux transporter CrcB [Planctomycetota bacterium]|nr:fluoride efflux transporter CrcB [Planctomycetota bacterium]
MLKQITIVGCGGCFGAISRMLVTDFVRRKFPAHPFLGTLAVNVLGCFLIGVLLGLIARESPLRLLLITGFLGSLTTFSTFGMDSVALCRQQQFGMALSYVAANVVVGCIAVWAGGSLVGFARW